MIIFYLHTFDETVYFCSVSAHQYFNPDDEEVLKVHETINAIKIFYKKDEKSEVNKPKDFVKPKKIQLLVKAVDAFVNERNLDIDVRFDIIAIHKEGKSFVIEHLIDAFYHF